MYDFVQKLIDDLPQQFKEREKIEQLYQVIGKQFQDIYEFYEELKTKRFLDTASGIQLDRIGEIVVLSRQDAARWLEIEEAGDEDYRKLLGLKISMNYGRATYKDIVSCIRALRGSMIGFKYKEDKTIPATIILETDNGPNDETVMAMSRTVIPRAAGVGVILRSKDSGDLNLVIGIASMISEEITISMDENVIPEELYTDENGDFLVDENRDLIVTLNEEESGSETPEEDEEQEPSE